MARKSAAKVAQAASPLQGCSISIAGTFAGTNQSTIQTRVESLGADIAKSVSSETTYLISTQKDFDKNTNKKVVDANSHNVPIVSLEWLDDCESTNTKANKSKYLFTALANSPAPAPAKMATKRPASPDSVASSTAVAPVSKKLKSVSDSRVGDGHNAKSSAIHVPLDEYCPNGSYQVHIASDGMIYDASLNQTNASNNNNKFYKIQLIRDSYGSDYRTWTRWGRVGERGQNAMLGDGSLATAISQFESKFKSKSGLNWAARGDNPKPSKYAYIEKSYNPDSDAEDDAADDNDGAPKDVSRRPSVQCTLDRPTAQLMELIFNHQLFAQTMTDLNYDADKLPLGKLSKGTINRGFQALKDLAALLDDNSLAQSTYQMSVPAAIEACSNAFYTLIPHAFGRNRPPVIQTTALLKKEIELLENLGDMKEAADMMKSNLKDDGGVHPLDRQFQTLGMDEMEALDNKSVEFAELSDYLTKTKGSTHHLNYQVQEIFRIQRNGEFDRFNKSPYAKISSDRRLLWHGSRVTNFGGILGQGLRIAPPEAPATGYMFGKGIYLADMSSKSANYCNSHASGGTALLLLCEAELGTPMQELTYASYTAGEDAKAKGMHSTWGKGTTGPQLWKDAKCVHPSLAGVKMPDVSVAPGPTGVSGASLLYNEFICYDIAQIRLRYLLRVKM